MKQLFLFAAARSLILTFTGCCSGNCPASSGIAGSWQLYGMQEDGTLLETPVIMSFGNDGNMTTVIEKNDVRKTTWKQDGKYIIIYQENEPTVRLERKGKDRIEFEWKGGKYEKKALKIILKRK